ncbi:MAG TPA: lipoyl(octanoyl) transferase LipB [Nitrospira sp.]|nr:lipoyl(octanoyl) transferase LipB [Nitrospira sp.]
MSLDRLIHEGAAAPFAGHATAERVEGPRPATLVCGGTMAYDEAWNLQRTCRAERAADRCHDLLLLIEHPSVYTLGRTTQDQHWPGEAQLSRETSIPVIRTERGGSITYHGPGQLVGYPILRLSDYCAGPKAYVRMLEEVLITTLAESGITARRREGLPGVWVGDDRPSKIASIGVRISHGITTHGFALNVCPDLEPFSHIVPCGISDCRVTSMSALMSTTPDLRVVQQQLAAHFAARFQLTWTESVALEQFAAVMEPPNRQLFPSSIPAPANPGGAP